MAATTTEKKAAAVGALVEGMSLRATSRLTGLSRARLDKLVLTMGRASERLLDEHVRGFRCDQLECDELWTYIGKRRHRVREDDPAEVGDAWIWSAVDPDSKLVPAHHVGKRQLFDARAFALRLQRRLAGRPQFNTDRLHAYRSAILGTFSTWDEQAGRWDRPDWGTVVKHFEVPEVRDQGRYVPPRMARAERRVEAVQGRHLLRAKRTATFAHLRFLVS